jgi:hypothetical protein
MVKERRREIRCLHLGMFPPEEKIVCKSLGVNLEED